MLHKKSQNQHQGVFISMQQTAVNSKCSGIFMDLSEAAHHEGIDIPVAISTALVQQLAPTPLLSSIGITFEQRVTNLLKLVRAHLKPSGPTGEPIEQQLTLPFMVLQAPVVSEEVLSIIVLVQQGEEGKPVITLTKARDNDDL
jgi:hypothetical protein